jgi:DNA-binding MarR family transcriptional regulator
VSEFKTEHVNQIRDFNRFYTNFLGVLNNKVLDSRFSLPEARILYEIYHRGKCTSSEILAELGIDKGYLSRILKSFDKTGIITRKKSAKDARFVYIMLTAKGKKVFEEIERTINQRVVRLLDNLSADEREALTRNMSEIKKILEDK